MTIKKYSSDQIYVSQFILNATGFMDCAEHSLQKSKAALKTVSQGGAQSVSLGFIVPAVANYAFAIELCLKAIICMEKGTKARGHSLNKLYGKVSPSSRRCLLTVSKRDASFIKKVINQNDNAFSEARYFEMRNMRPQDLKLLAKSIHVVCNLLLKEKLNSGEYV